MTVLPIGGYKSLRALNAFHALLLGLKMLPANVMKSYLEFFGAFNDKSEVEKEKMLREAVLFVELAEDEVEALISFATDENGIPYSKVNLKNLSVDKLHQIIVAVCMEIGRIKIDLVSEAEKKNCLTGQ